MGARKRKMAERQKEIRKQTAYAKLNNVPTSPRKMRLVADLIRGVEVNRALDILKYTKNEPSVRLEKLLKSAIANWEGKNEEEKERVGKRKCNRKKHYCGRWKNSEKDPDCPSGTRRKDPQTLKPRDYSIG